jgi:FkbM family methyltransferase
MNFGNLMLIDNGRLTASKDGQDRYAMDKIFFRKPYGYFLDIGASDGLMENNTYLMEKYYNWNGICCECDSRNIEKLCHQRNCHIVGSPIYKTTGNFVEFEINRSIHLSGIKGYQLEKYKDPNSNVVNMVTISLMDCLKKFNAPHIIDYMSLDTEGTEYEILSTFDFNQYKINYIALEHNLQEPKRTNIRNLLESNGYVLHRSHVMDDDYLLKSYALQKNIVV